MKTFTTSLLVNRLLTSAFTLTFIFITGNTVSFAKTDNRVNAGNTIMVSAVEYASLTAGATEKTVFIDWVTAYELNNSHFEVERSLDGKEFKTVAIVLDGFAAKGTGKAYKFKEASGDLKNGKTIYYRLKQIGTDNLVHYSKIMAVQMNAAVTVFPTQNTLNLTSTDANASSAGIKILLSNQSTISTSITCLPVAKQNQLSTGIFTGRIIMSETAQNNTQVFA